jgi:hypothetical protein
LPSIRMAILTLKLMLLPSHEPWQLQLLVQRAVGARDKAFLTFDVGYSLPEAYIRREQRAVTAPDEAAQPAAQASTAPQFPASASASEDDEPLWIKIWRARDPESFTALDCLAFVPPGVQLWSAGSARSVSRRCETRSGATRSRSRTWASARATSGLHSLTAASRPWHLVQADRGRRIGRGPSIFQPH